MIVNDNYSVVNKFGASLTDAARVVIYDRHMFIAQATELVSTSRYPSPLVRSPCPPPFLNKKSEN